MNLILRCWLVCLLPDVEKLCSRLDDGVEGVGEERREGEHVVHAQTHLLDEIIHLMVAIRNIPYKRGEALQDKGVKQAARTMQESKRLKGCCGVGKAFV